VAYSADSPGRPHLDAAEAALTDEEISQAKKKAFPPVTLSRWHARNSPGTAPES
jgi:hypothetical protein